jgi:hypothetical protein
LRAKEWRDGNVVVKRAFGAGFGAGFQGADGTSSVPPILRISFTVSALVQMLVYCLVVLYSVIIGAVDFVLPVKTAFLTVVFVVLMKPFDDFTVAWGLRKLNPTAAEDALLFLVIVLGAAVASVSVEFFFLVGPLSYINLTGEAIGVKASVISGIAILLLFVREQFKPLLGISLRKLKNWSERRKRK